MRETTDTKLIQVPLNGVCANESSIEVNRFQVKDFQKEDGVVKVRERGIQLNDCHIEQTQAKLEKSNVKNTQVDGSSVEGPLAKGIAPRWVNDQLQRHGGQAQIGQVSNRAISVEN